MIIKATTKNLIPQITLHGNNKCPLVIVFLGQNFWHLQLFLAPEKEVLQLFVLLKQVYLYNSQKLIKRPC